MVSPQPSVPGPAAAAFPAAPLLRDARLALCVDDDRPPFSFVVMDGRAQVSEDVALMRDRAARIGARYRGEDRAAEYAERNGVPGMLLVRMPIEKVLAFRGVAD
ncbi:hypothetical protein [Streptomyces auratus]|uniref:Uncharacterized protein n=1 Tax=Streptomyces auratus AGR0001 TaxID=1160718 RepID=J2A253_9ACTN|nr:hypothetical protein SU9_026915 [Streptomyces auratus AGR0001]